MSLSQVNRGNLQTDASGNLKVNVVVGGGGAGGSTSADYHATPPTFTDGTTNPLQMDANGNLKIAGSINATSAATYNSATQSFTTGTSNALQSDTHGSLLVTQRDSSGAVQGALGNPLRTDPTGTTTQPISGAINICNPTGALAGFFAKVGATGSLSVSADPITLFNDSFDGFSFDTTNRWTTGGTVPPSCATGVATILSGASTSATSSLVSQPTFPAPGTSFKVVGFIAKFESIASPAGAAGYLNSHRFLGCGTVPTTWTTSYTASSSSGPLLDAFGFEIDVDGKMYPVVYSNGVRTRVPLLFGGSDIATGNGTGTGTTLGGLKTLFDGNYHLFAISSRADSILFIVDNIDMPIAVFSATSSGTWSTPNTQNLPLRFHSINSSGSAPSGTMVFSAGAVAVGDTGTNSNQISDGTYPWRKTKVDSTGSLMIGAGSAVTTTGNITASAQSISASVAGYSHVGVSISGTYAAVNVTFEFSDDGGTTWYGMQMTRSDSSVVETTSGSLTNTSRAWDASIPSVTNVRVRSTAWTSGTAVIRIIPSAFPCVYNVSGNIRVTDATAANFMPTMNTAATRGFMTVTDGTNSMPTGDAAARGVYHRITDGTNQAAVKAASTAAAAADPALVVSVSPNTPAKIWDGTNTAAVKAASTAAAAADPSLVVNISPNSPAHPVYLKPQTSGGLTAYKLVSAATTNANFIKASAGQLYNLQLFNNGATAAYFKMSNTTAAPTVGSTAVVKSIMIPAGGGAVVEWANGVPFTTGISFCITGAAADSDTTAVALSQVIVNADYA